MVERVGLVARNRNYLTVGLEQCLAVSAKASWRASKSRSRAREWLSLRPFRGARHRDKQRRSLGVDQNAGG